MKVLLVSPGFHGYATSIGQTFASLGYATRVHVYDDLPGFMGRSLWSSPHGKLATATRVWLTSRGIHALRDFRPDVVVTIKGDQFTDDWWDAISVAGAARVTWFYDELERMQYQRADLESLGPLATYSRVDASGLQQAGIDAHHLPLGYDAITPVADITASGVTFIGARYDNREDALRELAARDVPITAYGRHWSRRFVDRARTNFPPDPGVPSRPEISRSNAYGVMRASDATLNLHRNQDGFTMRTFEAAGVGGVEICDRPDVSDHYDVGSEVLVYDGIDELADLAARACRDHRWTARIRAAAKKRTLAEHTLAHRIRVLESLWA